MPDLPVPTPLDDLARMWQDCDPPPAGLADRMILGLVLADLDAEYEVLTLVEQTRRLLGTRDNANALTVAFAARGRSLMLRVSPLPAGRRRVDGWVGPAQAVRIRLVGTAQQLDCQADRTGRFELPDVDAGPVRVLVTGWPGEADDDAAGFATPTFEL